MDKTLEGELPDEELSQFLVTMNFTKSNCFGVETMGLLDITGCVLQTDQQKNKLSTAVLHANNLATNCLWGTLPKGAQQ
jgi:hypothetical protein